MISPQMNLFSKSEWMTPAACGAFVPLRMVHARTSSGPQVKYRISWVSVRLGCVCAYLRGEGKRTSREVYPAWVIFPSALVAPAFFSSSAFSSAGKGARRSSRATEKGMSGSPGLLASIHALIRESLGEVCVNYCGLAHGRSGATICFSCGHSPSRID